MRASEDSSTSIHQKFSDIITALIEAAFKWIKGIKPYQLKWGIIVIWLAFLLALLASNFFGIAFKSGIFAAIEYGAINGPLHSVTVVPCEFHALTYMSNCGVYEDLPSFTVSLKLLFALAVILSAGLAFWASERARLSRPQIGNS